MSAVIEDVAASSPLSPEQRALLEYLGGEERVRHAIHVLRVDVDDNVTPERLRVAVAQVLQDHGILSAAIRHVPGYRGLRIHNMNERTPGTWLVIEDDDDSAKFRRMPLDVGNGALWRGAFVRRNGARPVLYLAVSALVADRGSLADLSGRIASAYAGQAGAEEVFQYEQYTEWRRELNADDAAAVERRYWQRYLNDTDAWTAPRLVYRRSGAPEPASERFCAVDRIDAALMARAVEVATAAGVRLEVLLQTVWWVLQARLTGFNRYAAGWQHDCRSDYDVMRGAVGVFDKVLPLVIEGGGDEPFAAWLARMAACASAHIEAQEHCPIDALTSTAHLAIGFSYCDRTSPLCATSWRVVELPGPMPCFELALQIDALGDGVELAVYADASLYPRRGIDRLLSQYVALLHGALEQPGSPVSELPWIGESEWRALQVDWHGPNVDFGEQGIAQRIAHWAQATPNALAIVAGAQRMTYAALDARANRLGHWMRSQGVEVGALVALELPRSPDLIVAMLAAWRIGAGYLPLEPEWPAARRQVVLDDAHPALVLCTVQVADIGPWRAALVGGIDLDTFAAEPPHYTPRLDDPAYVLYTSGSTGQPKGVVIEQRQLLNYVAAASSAMDLANCRRWGLPTSVVADLGNTALFGALFNGSCLVLADANEARDSAAFARFMADHDIDALKIVPSHLEALLECDVPRLPRTLVLGGEAAPRALIERIALLAPECTVYNHYGPTEATVGVMVHRLDRGESVQDVLPLTGVLANNRVYVLDTALRPVPAGGLGELYVGGAQVCRGYLNREVEGVFVADPWQPGQRLYRTGDLAWVLPEGGVRLAGRADHQIKIRGYRVEPSEVEAGLLSLPGVRQAVVIARGGTAGTELVAFIASGGADASDISVWREQLAKLLPEHMLPATHVLLDEFPRLPNGKIDRLALVEMHDATPQAPGAGLEPGSPLETVLAESMAALLGHKQVAADADFFELGGHSLLVIRLVARIRKLLNIEIEPGLVFDHPTAQTLAAALCAVHDPVQLDRLAQVHGAQA